MGTPLPEPHGSLRQLLRERHDDELERLFTLYDGGQLDRRQLVQGRLGLGLGAGVANPRDGSASGRLRAPLFRAHTINHITSRTADVLRSKASYQSLTGLPVRAEDSDSCEFRLEHGFLGLYALEGGRRRVQLAEVTYKR